MAVFVYNGVRESGCGRDAGSAIASATGRSESEKTSVFKEGYMQVELSNDTIQAVFDTHGAELKSLKKKYLKLKLKKFFNWGDDEISY